MCEQQDNNKATEEAISKTQACSASLGIPVHRGYASHDQGHVDREDPGVRRDSTPPLEEEPIGSQAERAQGRTWASSRSATQEHDDGAQPSSQEEVRPPVPCPNGAAEADHGSRDDPQAPRPGESGHSGEDRSHSPRPDGLWKTFRQDLRRSADVRCAIRRVVHDDCQGGDSQLEDVAFSQVDQDAGRAISAESSSTQGCKPVSQEGLLHPPEGLPRFGKDYRRGIFVRAHRRLLPDGDSSALLGRGTDSGASSGEVGGADSRVEASAGTSAQESSYEGGSRGEEPTSGGIDLHSTEIDEKEGMRFSEHASRPLGSNKEKQIFNQFQHHLEENWDFLVSSNRCRLLEVCCSPESVLTDTCLKTFGPGSAVRVAHWNGGDIETTKGREHIKRLAEELKPSAMWFSPECGPYSPMQHLNRRSEKQRQELEEKRRHARLQYEGVVK